MYINKLTNKPVEKNCFHIYLINIKNKIVRNYKQYCEYYGFYDCRIGLIELYPILLEISSYYLFCFKFCFITIDIQFNSEFLFATYWLVFNFYFIYWDELIFLKLIYFFLNCIDPLLCITVAYGSLVYLQLINN